MKQTMLLKLQPNPVDHGRLLQTMERFNAACNAIAATAFEHKTASKFQLQKLVYHDVRARFGLSAQMTIRAIAKVAETYKRDKSIRPTFRLRGAMTYDERIMSFKGPDRVSLLTLDGRIIVPFRVGAYQSGRMDRIRGQADLLYRDGTFFLAVTVDAPESEPRDVEDYIGLDMGVTNIVVTSDGDIMSSETVKRVRHRNHRLRQRLQAKGTRSAKRLLRKRRRKESRFARDTNHVISKRIVSLAQGTGRGIALEDLTHIRTRTTVRKAQRREHASWSFSQLRFFIEYKARVAGVPVVAVDPRNTSRTCPDCGCIDKANRKSQSEFLCTSCGFAGHADVIAAGNIRRRAVVMRPDAAGIAA
jgi:IS605 OrfB family transposase